MYRTLYFIINSPSKKRNASKYLNELTCVKNTKKHKIYEGEEVLISLNRNLITAIIYNDKNRACIDKVNNIFA